MKSKPMVAGKRINRAVNELLDSGERPAFWSRSKQLRKSPLSRPFEFLTLEQRCLFTISAAPVGSVIAIDEHGVEQVFSPAAPITLLLGDRTGIPLLPGQAGFISSDDLSIQITVPGDTNDIETDTIYASDALDFSASTGGVIANLQTDTFIATMSSRQIQTGAAGQAANFEYVYGGTVGDHITGNAAANSLSGNGGNDTIGGAGGNDTIGGSTGNDNITGGTGNDILNGGGDNDTLFAADGLADTIDGGTGTDSLGSSDAGLDSVSNVP